MTLPPCRTSAFVPFLFLEEKNTFSDAIYTSTKAFSTCSMEANRHERIPFSFLLVAADADYLFTSFQLIYAHLRIYISLYLSRVQCFSCVYLSQSYSHMKSYFNINVYSLMCSVLRPLQNCKPMYMITEI